MTGRSRVEGVTSMGFTPPDEQLRRKVAIVGIGDTDYAADYRASRAAGSGHPVASVESLATTAFERALADSGLRRQDIDGLSVSVMYGAPDVEAMAAVLGIEPRYTALASGIMDDVVGPAVSAVAAGKCDTIALVYSAPSRSVNMKYGGQRFSGEAPKSYYYFHPWGWSSQAAHWAFMFQQYQNQFGATEADLGSVALTLRQHAMRNPNAIMREPLTLEDYLGSRYIVRPLHLLDMCLVNDGGVCLILRRSNQSRDLAHVPVDIAGWAHAKVANRKLHYMVRERLQPQLRAAGTQALQMAGLALSDVQHFQAYDAASIHLINQMEGYGFVGAGEGLEFCKAGEMDLGGRLPVNTSGGMLSEAYMHGWNHVVEAVRQLRHEAGERQVQDISVSMFSLATTESAHPLILTRGQS